MTGTALIALILAPVCFAAEEMPSIAGVLEEHGMFTFTDGSSLYRFFADGSFLQEPAGLSGRAVEGTWKSEDHVVFIIEGTWTWYNGISPLNDRRVMTLVITLHSEVPDTSGSMPVWPVYFTVDELVAITPVQ